MANVTTENYVAEARKAIKNQVLQRALADFEVRMQTVENLDVVLETLAANIRKNGSQVFFAEDGQAAVNYCLEVAHRHKVSRVVKGKSMVSEEIGLNDALIDSGIDVSETDLGEYIIQLAGETPSHIIAPAIHKTRDDVGSLYSIFLMKRIRRD
jgi:L-lactate dehydrogenase complex protein LldF